MRKEVVQDHKAISCVCLYSNLMKISKVFRAQTNLNNKSFVATTLSPRTRDPIWSAAYILYVTKLKVIRQKHFAPFTHNYEMANLPYV